MKITKDWLNKHDACEDAVTRFCEVYPAEKQHSMTLLPAWSEPTGYCGSWSIRALPIVRWCDWRASALGVPSGMCQMARRAPCRR